MLGNAWLISNHGRLAVARQHDLQVCCERRTFFPRSEEIDDDDNDGSDNSTVTTGFYSKLCGRGA